MCEYTCLFLKIYLLTKKQAVGKEKLAMKWENQETDGPWFSQPCTFSSPWEVVLK